MLLYQVNSRHVTQNVPNTRSSEQALMCVYENCGAGEGGTHDTEQVDTCWTRTTGKRHNEVCRFACTGDEPGRCSATQ